MFISRLCSYFTLVVTISIFLACACRAAAIAAVDRPTISLKQFRACVSKGATIENVTVPADYLRLVFTDGSLNGSQVSAAGKLCLVNTTIAGSLQAERLNVSVPISVRDSEVLLSIQCAGSKFHSPVEFSNCKFRKGAAFPESVFHGGLVIANCDCPFVGFNKSKFDGPLIVYHSSVECLDLSDSIFGSDLSVCQVEIKRAMWLSGSRCSGAVKLDGCALLGGASIDARSASFSGVTSFRNVTGNAYNCVYVNGSVFHNTAYFNGINVFLFEASTDANAGRAVVLGMLDRLNPTTFEKAVYFRDASCGIVVEETVFRDAVDFSGTIFRDPADFAEVTFGGEVNFLRCVFPETGEKPLSYPGMHFGFCLDKATFGGRVLLKWEQLEEADQHWSFDPKVKLAGAGPETWARLASAFHEAGNLQGENESTYRQYLVAETTSEVTGWRKLLHRLPWLLWGYGLRPWRLAAWMCVGFALVVLVYWTQTRSLGAKLGRTPRMITRLKYASWVALNVCCPAKPKYGCAVALNWQMKAFGLCVYILSQAGLSLFLYAMSRVNPVLHEVAGRLVGRLG